MIRPCCEHERESAEQQNGVPLFWSKRGKVACARHAPLPQSLEWIEAGWCDIPDSANGRHCLYFQCPDCDSKGRSLRHNSHRRGARLT